MYIMIIECRQLVKKIIAFLDILIKIKIKKKLIK